VGLFEFGAREMTALRTAVQEDLLESTSLTAAAAAAWRDALTFHHQWCVLAREHAAALVHHMRDILRVRAQT
jgi:hypothetical protein